MNKDSILQVLNKISSSYQDYSGKRRLRNIELGKNFYKKQIDIYSNKSLDSLKKAQNYGMDQDLTILQGESEIDSEIPNVINIEAIRVKNKNEIRAIDVQLKQIKEVGNSEEIMYIGMSIPELVNQGLPQQIDTLDKELSYISDQLERIDQIKMIEGLLILLKDQFLH